MKFHQCGNNVKNCDESLSPGSRAVGDGGSLKALWGSGLLDNAFSSFVIQGDEKRATIK